MYGGPEGSTKIIKNYNISKHLTTQIKTSECKNYI